MKGPSGKCFATRRHIDGSVTSQGSRIESGRRAFEAATDRSQRSDSLVVGSYMCVGDRRVESKSSARALIAGPLVPFLRSSKERAKLVAGDALAARRKWLISKGWLIDTGIMNPLKRAGLTCSNA